MKFIDTHWEYIIFVVVTIILTIILAKLMRRFLSRFFKISSEHLRVDPTNYKFSRHAATFLIYLLAAMLIFYTIPKFRALGLTLFAGAGVLAAILGFASQAAFSNIISGVFIVIFRPFRVEDLIQIGTEHTGYVEDITLRHTVIRNFENRRIIIPNSQISSQTIVNSSIEDEKICNFLFFTLSYDSDIERAKEIIREHAAAHKNFLDNRTPEEKNAGEQAVVIRILDFLETGLRLRASIWSETPPKGFVMLCDLRESIKKQFASEGIEIPYPYRMIIEKHPKQR